MVEVISDFVEDFAPSVVLLSSPRTHFRPRRPHVSPSTRFRAAGICGLAIVLGMFLPSWSDEPKGKSYALLVGVKDYGERSTLGPLKYTENDAEELAKVL